MNSTKFDFLGIKKYHDAGFKGAGITIASRESDISLHGMKVYDIIKQIVPEATILTSANYKDLPKCDIYTTSLFFNSDKNESSERALKQLNDNGTFICCAIGNDSEDSATAMSNYEFVNSVGACILKDDKPERAYYSSISNNLDFMSLTNWYTTAGAKFTGTSCASPVFASMCVLVQEFFMQKIGRKLTNEEMLEFVKANCVDLNVEGKDKYTGNGIFILPDPDKIDLSKYTDEQVKQVEEPQPVEKTESDIIAEAEKEVTDLCTCEKCGKLRTILRKLINLFKKK